MPTYPQAGTNPQTVNSLIPSHPQVASEAGESPSENEIIAVNHHTNSVEFHGSTSSVSFLGSLQKLQRQEDMRNEPSPSRSLYLIYTIQLLSCLYLRRTQLQRHCAATFTSNGFTGSWMRTSLAYILCISLSTRKVSYRAQTIYGWARGTTEGMPSWRFTRACYHLAL